MFGKQMRNENLVQWKLDKECRLKASTAVYSICGDRRSQQDFAAIAEKEEELLAIICDGMGGLTGGERASREAVMTLVNAYRRENISDGSAFLRKAVLEANNTVANLKAERGRLLNAGTTMVAVHLTKCGVEWVSVGDSRIYLFHDGRLRQLTIDHNYREQLKLEYKNGVITEKTYQREIKGTMVDALTSYIGMHGELKIDQSSKKLNFQCGDQILLCSDGIYKSLSHAQIEAMLSDNAIDPWVSSRRLVHMAWEQAKRKQDNTTVILIKAKK